MVFNVYYLKGLCEILKSINNGRCNHKRDNVIQALVLCIAARNKGYPIEEELVKECVEKALALIRKELIY